MLHSILAPPLEILRPTKKLWEQPPTGYLSNGVQQGLDPDTDRILTPELCQPLLGFSSFMGLGFTHITKWECACLAKLISASVSL